MKTLLLILFLLSGTVTTVQEVVKVNVRNTFAKTDKTGTFKAMLNEQIRTLILVSVDNPDYVLNMIYHEGGKCEIKDYVKGVLQSSKVIYRRSDLEKNDGRLIYTSRTGEVTVTFYY